ncbi:MAG TPA: response regulator, partial [Acidimicrobiales bacterium]
MRSPIEPTSTVLYVEDETLNRELMRSVFRLRPALRLVEARLGADAIEMAEQESPDLILLDRNLPDMNGEEVLQRLRSCAKTLHTPVVIISGDTARPQSNEQELGVLGYVTKPYNIVALLAQIDAVLGRAAAR